MNNTKEQLEEIFNKRHEVYKDNASFGVDIDSNVSPFENARTIHSLVRLLCK
jgi:shikimate kinase